MINFNDTKTAFEYKSTGSLKQSKLLFKTIASNALVKTGKALANTAIKIKFPIGWAIKPTLYKHFVGGETLEDCEKTVELLNKYNVKTILDYSVEGSTDRAHMEATLQETLASVIHAAKHPDIPFAVFKPTAFASKELLTRIADNSNLYEKEKDDKEFFEKSVETLCKTAYENDIPIMIDAEDSWYQEYLDELIENLMVKYNTEKGIVFNTYQMYRTDRLEYLKGQLERAKEKNYIIGAKFVRGAYMEKERERAEQKGYPSPIQPDKISTDKHFDAGIEFAVDNLQNFSIFCGTHNEKSNLRLAEHMVEKNISPNDNRIWFSQLYGMSDHISFNLAKAGYNVAKYTPYGKVNSILPYLIRRAEENTSVAGQTSRELSLINAELKRRSNNKE
ncbi:MAG: proline dehydrogenase family protein [Bacteroidales bacterium]|jgi:proline dehydrogenase